ncbi:MAG: helix-turn-helix transcriptional regulator [bacterium]|nr:helix-turn-helix transcriptional regulator [bacterium]
MTDSQRLPHSFSARYSDCVSRTPEDMLIAVLGDDSNAAVARAVGVDPSTVSRWRSEERRPSYEVLKRICEWRGISADQIIGVGGGVVDQAAKDGQEDLTLVPIVTLDIAASRHIPAGAARGAMAYPTEWIRLLRVPEARIVATLYRSAILLVDTGYPSPSEIKKLRMERAHVLAEVQGTITPALALVRGVLLNLQRPEDPEPIGVPINKGSILDYVKGRILATTNPLNSTDRLEIAPSPSKGYPAVDATTGSPGA